DYPALRRRVDDLLGAFRALPGVKAAATSLAPPGVPMLFPTALRIIEGSADPNRRVIATTRVVSAGYFATMSIPLLEGELCNETPGPLQAVVNRTFVNTYLAGLPAIGRHFEVAGNQFFGTTEIRGIVGDAREQGLYKPPTPIVYTCFNAPIPSPVFLVRTAADPKALADTIRKKIHEIEPSRSMYEVFSLEERLD